MGPDLTGVGAIRSGHDILEAIVFPSASFVPGFEIYNVETRTETYSGVRGEDTPAAISLAVVTISVAAGAWLQTRRLRFE